MKTEPNKEKKKNVDYKNLNEVISLSKKILKIFFILLIVISLYIVTILFKELHLKENVITVLKIASPLFIGIFVAWLFDPLVTLLQKKGIRRGLGTTLVYVIFLTILGLIIGTLIPVLADQINDFVKTIPNIFDKIYDILDKVFNRLDDIKNINTASIKSNIFNQISDFGTNLTKSLPGITFKLIKSFFSGIGIFLVGLIIGFYLLINFNSAQSTIITLLPRGIRKDAQILIDELNLTCRNFITGALLDSLLIFCVSSVAFLITGLKAPLLFGLFCGITNVIPYAGPYIGGAPAVIVAFSQSIPCGIFTLISIIIIQALEGNLLQPLIMAKSTKLHPVTIMIGLLIFGYFFGIIGMIISTPLIGMIKAIIIFFNRKYAIFEFKNKNNE